MGWSWQKSHRPKKVRPLLRYAIFFPVESMTVCHRLETLSSWMQRQTSIVKIQNSSICPSPAGGLPWRTVNTSREDEVTVKAGFDLYKSLLPARAFFWKSIFHLLQVLWRWEWKSDNRIGKFDRPTLFNLFKALVYAKTEEEYNTVGKDLLQNATVAKYPQFPRHVQNDILTRKAEWAVSERIERNLSTHNINTTNYVEVSFRLTKDSQFNCVRAYNLPDLLDIVLDDSVYYATR